MPKISRPLTDKAVQAARGKSARQEIADGGRPGLYLVVQPSGKKTWAVRYRFADKSRKLTLGDYPDKSLQEAREAAREALDLVAAGRDPGFRAVKLAKESEEGEVVEALSGASTIDKVAAQFLAMHKTRWREKTMTETSRLLDRHILGKQRRGEEALPSWQGLQIRAITRNDIHNVIDPAMMAGKPYLANRIFAALRQLLGWCVVRGLIAKSPADGMPVPGDERSRDRVLSSEEIACLWRACEAVGHPWGTLAKLLLVTGQRREEVAGMRWSELDLTGRDPVWTIPRDRAKNDVAHTVPLAPQVVAILNGVEKVKESDFVLTTTGAASVSGFSKGKAIIDKAMLAELRKSDESAELVNWRFHDLRRTAASGMAALGNPVQVVEIVLNHQTGVRSTLARIYDRHDYAKEKRKALVGWARKVADMAVEKKHGGAELIKLENFRTA